MKVKCESEVAKSCPTLSNPMDCSLPGSSVHGIFQAGVLEWAATGHRAPSSNGYHGHAVSHRKIRHVFFKLWGSNLFQFFRIQFKGVRLELLAPICKRKKVTSTIFLPEASLSVLDGGVDRLYTEAFLPWSDLVCPSLMQALYSSLLVLPPRWDGIHQGRPDGIPD